MSSGACAAGDAIRQTASNKGARTRWILHPALFSAAYVLDVALANEVEPAGFLRPLAIAVATGGVLTLVGWAVLRDRWAGGLAATAVVVLLLSLHPIGATWEALQAAFGAQLAVLGLAVLGFTILALPGALVLRARHSQRPIRGPATSVLNQLSAVLIIVSVIFHAGPDLPGMVDRFLRERPPIAVPPGGDRPDMVVLLLDGYPRADVLARRFGYNSSPFLDELRSAGFDVATDSRSNYIFTQLTLASMFQMRHLEEIPSLRPLLGTGGGHHGPLRAALYDGQAFSALRAAGYEIAAISAGYEHTSLRGVADRVMDHGEYTDLERNLLSRTWLPDLFALVIGERYSVPQRDRIAHAFDDLEALAADPASGPIFAFVHVPAPHLPLVVDADGNAIPLDLRRWDAQLAYEFGMTDAEFAAAYVDELTYLNRRTLAAIETLQAADGGGDPVIVVMSDHGYTHDVDRMDVEARLGTLFAAYTPGADGLFADPPTPVNLMSRLLNRYLGTDFAVAPDRHYISAGPEDLLQLTEVLDAR